MARQPQQPAAEHRAHEAPSSANHRGLLSFCDPERHCQIEFREGDRQHRPNDQQDHHGPLPRPRNRGAPRPAVPNAEGHATLARRPKSAQQPAHRLRFDAYGKAHMAGLRPRARKPHAGLPLRPIATRQNGGSGRIPRPARPRTHDLRAPRRGVQPWQTPARHCKGHRHIVGNDEGKDDGVRRQRPANQHVDHT